jgi:hypothetical protein
MRRSSLAPTQLWPNAALVADVERVVRGAPPRIPPLK